MTTKQWITWLCNILGCSNPRVSLERRVGIALVSMAVKLDGIGVDAALGGGDTRHLIVGFKENLQAVVNAEGFTVIWFYADLKAECEHREEVETLGFTPKARRDNADAAVYSNRILVVA